MIFFIVLFVGGFGTSAFGNFVLGGMLEGFDATAETGTSITVTSPEGEQVWVWTTIATRNVQCTATDRDGTAIAVTPISDDINVVDSSTGTNHVYRPTFEVDVPPGSATIMCDEDRDSSSTYGQVYAVGEPKSEFIYDAEIFLTIAGAIAGMIGLLGIFITRAIGLLVGSPRFWRNDSAKEA